MQVQIELDVHHFMGCLVSKLMFTHLLHEKEQEENINQQDELTRQVKAIQCNKEQYECEKYHLTEYIDSERNTAKKKRKIFSQNLDKFEFN